MKRNPESQLTKDEFLASDDRDDGEGAPSAEGFEKAPPDVMAKRRIVKVRRTITRPTPESAASEEKPENPFAAVQNPATSNPIANVLNPVDEAPKPENPFANAKIPDPAPTKEAHPATEKDDEKKDAISSEKQPTEDDKKVAETSSKPSEQPNETNEKEDTVEKEVKPPTETPSESKPEEAAPKPPAEQAVKDTPAERPSKTTNTEEKNESKTDKEKVAEKTDVTTNGASQPSSDLPLNGNKSQDLNPISAAAGHAKSGSLKPFSFGGLSGLSPAKTFASAATAGDHADSFAVKATPTIEANKKDSTPAFKEAHVETGEEDEEEVFRGRAKLYSLEVDEKSVRSWKERGVGPLKLNKHKESGSLRLLMRTEATLRVVLNTAVFPGFKADQATERSLRFQGFESRDSESRKSFLVKFGTRDEVSSLMSTIKKYNKGTDEK